MKVFLRSSDFETFFRHYFLRMRAKFAKINVARINVTLINFFRVHQTKLFESTKFEYLGLILDNKLNWKSHITYSKFDIQVQ